MAQPDDGLLDLSLLASDKLLRRLHLADHTKKGTHIHDKESRYYRGKKIRTKLTKELNIEIDGELHTAEEEILIESLPEMYNMITF